MTDTEQPIKPCPNPACGSEVLIWWAGVAEQPPDIRCKDCFFTARTEIWQALLRREEIRDDLLWLSRTIRDRAEPFRNATAESCRARDIIMGFEGCADDLAYHAEKKYGSGEEED